MGQVKEVFLQSDFAMVFVTSRISLHFVKCVPGVGRSGGLELLTGELRYSSGSGKSTDGCCGEVTGGDFVWAGMRESTAPGPWESQA